MRWKVTVVVSHSNYLQLDVKLLVKFRVILMQMDLKPYTEPVTVFILVTLTWSHLRWCFDAIFDGFLFRIQKGTSCAAGLHSIPETVVLLTLADHSFVKCKYWVTGVVSLAYQLPPFPSKGKWTIRVEALSQVYEQQFFVERYYITFFEVTVRLTFKMTE